MGRVALVTGGTRGIGEAISVALKAAGKTVVANFAGNEEAAKAFTEKTGIPAYKWDVSDFEACKAGRSRSSSTMPGLPATASSTRCRSTSGTR